uniref:Uncharacterized protein MANES_17G121600 n=1 Tax=Rhizophora mucronata TaxID=61149 RepID=A0A2P2LJJ2_RHIMU
MLIGPGFATGSYIHLLCLGSLLITNWRAMRLIFSITVRIQMADMVEDLDSCLILQQLMLQSIHLLLWAERRPCHQLIEVNCPPFCSE